MRRTSRSRAGARGIAARFHSGTWPSGHARRDRSTRAARAFAEASAVTRAVRDESIPFLRVCSPQGWLCWREGRRCGRAQLRTRCRDRSHRDRTEAGGPDRRWQRASRRWAACRRWLATRRRRPASRHALRRAGRLVKPTKLWWRHSRALRGQRPERAKRARRSERAWGQLLGSFPSLSDEGCAATISTSARRTASSCSRGSSTRASKAAAPAARSAPRRQDEPRRAVRAAGRHRPATERDQERGRARTSSSSTK